ncbi:MAG: metallophosphoesterase [Bacteroidia bacterium]|nr:metallophosphoesterase [Bacteroidia bacterium]
MASIQNIHKRLDFLSKKATSFNMDVDSEKWIVFSDHHRGIGDGADDFAICKSNYLEALSYYKNEGYGLIILGDAEEFWENTLKNVITKYKDVLQVEKEFYLQNRLIKIWGNHDDAWNHLAKVKKHLFPFFDNIKTYEAVNFKLTSNSKSLGDMLLVHGHQGSTASDRFAGISRWFVRVIWRNIQRWFKIPLSTPAKSKNLKDKHDIAMHSWAKQKSKQLIICGHTHQPVFMSKNHLDVLEKQLEGLDHDKPENTGAIKEIRNKIAQLRKKTTAIGTLVSDNKPCYFNSGCCSFSDGDITGIEIAEGEIRLIKWGQSKRVPIDTEKLSDLYQLL